MSIASLAETHGLLQQTRDNLVVWSEAYQEENPGRTIIKIPTNMLLILPQGMKVNFKSPSQVLLPTPLSLGLCKHTLITK
jgi:hypothetical protein